jgi:hypothetical protein
MKEILKEAEKYFRAYRRGCRIMKGKDYRSQA